MSNLHLRNEGNCSTNELFPTYKFHTKDYHFRSNFPLVHTQTNTFTNQELSQQEHKHQRTSLTQMENNTEEKRKVNGTFRLNDEATSQKRGKHKSIIISFTKSETEKKKLKGLKKPSV